MTTTAVTTQAAAAPGKQVAAMPKTVNAWLTSDYFKKQVALCLPKHVTPERFLRVALSTVMRTPKLGKCTPESVVNCCLTLSALGLEPDGRRAHLIPFDDNKNRVTVCTLIVDYKGLVELAMNSGMVSSIFAEVICDKDEFTWDTGEVHHRINWKEARGEPYAAYVVIQFKDGGKHTEVMQKHDIYAVRDKSSGWRAFKAGYAKQSPWADPQSEAEMWKKTVFRRASKWVKLSPEVYDALEKDDRETQGRALVAEVGNIIELPETASESEETDSNQEPSDKESSKEQQQSTRQPISAPTEAQPHHSQEAQQKPAGGTTPPPAGAAPSTTEPGQEQIHTLQQSLEEVVTQGGFTFSDFAQWGEGTGNVPDATSLPGFSEVPTEICKRLLRAKVGMLKGLGGK